MCLCSQQRTTGNVGERGGVEGGGKTRQDAGPGAVAVHRPKRNRGHTEEYESRAIGAEHTSTYAHATRSTEI